ncbi:MAG: hypothetical protein RM022_009500 [Nostoc sp. EfeVER01]
MYQNPNLAEPEAINHNNYFKTEKQTLASMSLPEPVKYLMKLKNWQ